MKDPIYLYTALRTYVELLLTIISQRLAVSGKEGIQ